jgi:hypothetical protein
MNAVTKEQVGAYLQVVKAIADGIRDAGPLGIGEGPIYEMVCGIMSLDAFERTIGILTRSGLIKRQDHCLTWIEPVQRRD